MVPPRLHFLLASFIFLSNTITSHAAPTCKSIGHSQPYVHPPSLGVPPSSTKQSPIEQQLRETTFTLQKRSQGTFLSGTDPLPLTTKEITELYRATIAPDDILFYTGLVSRSGFKNYERHHPGKKTVHSIWQDSWLSEFCSATTRKIKQPILAFHGLIEKDQEKEWFIRLSEGLALAAEGAEEVTLLVGPDFDERLMRGSFWGAVEFPVIKRLGSKPRVRTVVIVDDEGNVDEEAGYQLWPKLEERYLVDFEQAGVRCSDLRSSKSLGTSPS